jgi:hypothetical protein
MDLKEYFENKKGLGVLATADGEGKVDLAVYSRPHVMDEHTVAFIMPDRLTHHNLQANPHAAYLFLEEGTEGRQFKGMRLFLTKIREEQDSELLQSLRRRRYGDDDTTRFLVFFGIDRKLAPIGPAEIQD